VLVKLSVIVCVNSWLAFATLARLSKSMKCVQPIHANGKCNRGSCLNEHLIEETELNKTSKWLLFKELSKFALKV
jgi:hypothetical protein